MKKKYLQQKVEEAKLILDKNICTHITTADLSRLVGLNECDLKKGFRLFLNNTIYQYQLELKMNRAMELVTTTEKTESEIAKICRYKHTSNFVTAFTNFFNHPPSHYRKE